jgi:transposase-like protein
MTNNNSTEEARKKALQAKKEIIERLIEAEVEEILPQRYAKKREGKETPLICPNCGVRKANQIRRDGHYRRKLRVAEGVIEDLHIPRIECMDCGRYLKLDFKILDPKRRYLEKDIDEEILRLYLSGASFRKIKTMLEEKLQRE